MQLCQSWAQLFRILRWLTKQSDDQINMHIDDNEIEDKKIQQIYEIRDTPLSSADISIFHQKSANFALSRNTDVGFILIHNF